MPYRTVRELVEEYMEKGYSFDEAVAEVRRRYIVRPRRALSPATGDTWILLFTVVSLATSPFLYGSPPYLFFIIPLRFIVPGYCLLRITGHMPRGNELLGLAYSIGISMAYTAIYGYAAGITGLYTVPMLENTVFHAALLIIESYCLVIGDRQRKIWAGKGGG